MNLPILALIIANIIWGAASPVFKWSLGGIPPFTLAFFRFYIASVILFLILRKKVFNVKKDQIPKIFLVAFFGVTLNISLFFLGIKLSKSINAPVIASTQPLIVFIIAVIFLREKLRINKLFGLILGFAGVGIIIIKPILDQGGFALESIGDILLVGATLGAVGQTIFSKQLMNDHQKINPFVLTFWIFLFGTISFIPMFLSEILSPTFDIISLMNIKPIIGVIFGAFFSSLIAYSFYTFGLSKIPASESGIFTYIDPIIAIIIAIPLLGEKITIEFILGTILIFGGIFLAEHRIHYHPFYKLKVQSAKLKVEVKN